MKSFIMIGLMTLVLAACNGLDVRAKKFEKILEASSGQNQTLAKLWTEKSGYVVFKNEVTGEYTAYNLDIFDKKKMKTYDSYLAASSTNDIVANLASGQEWVVEGHWYEESSTSTSCDSDGNCYDTTTYWTTDIWVDTSHWYTFYTGGGFRFENSNSSTHDLDTLAAMREDMVLNYMSHQLTSEFSLSSARADELAKLAWRYNKLENRRELTADEKNIFVMQSLGVSFTKVEAAMRNRAGGNDTSYQDLLNTASDYNRTTPEEIGRFFETDIADEF
jgi:hypothetical protein